VTSCLSEFNILRANKLVAQGLQFCCVKCQSIIQVTTVCDRSVKSTGALYGSSWGRCERDIRGTCHLMVTNIHYHHRGLGRGHRGPRDSWLLNYNIIKKIGSHGECSQTLVRYRTAFQPTRPAIHCQLHVRLWLNMLRTQSRVWTAAPSSLSA
jgi:hypothetical protein